MKKEFLKKTRDGVKKASARAKMLTAAAGISCMAALSSFAADASGSGSADISSVLTSSFQSTAETITGTVTSALPVIMSIVGLGVCIQFGIRFFKRFAK